MFDLFIIFQYIWAFFKGARSYFSKFSVLFHFKGSSLQRCKSKISGESVNLFGCTMQFCTLQLPISYCVSFIVTIIKHICIASFQMEHFPAVKFSMGLRKIWVFVSYQNLQKLRNWIDLLYSFNLFHYSFNLFHWTLSKKV